MFRELTLERGAPLLCGCVGQNLDKEAKFDLKTRTRKTITRSARLTLSRAQKLLQDNDGLMA